MTTFLTVNAGYATDAGTAGATFMKVPVNARAVSLGGSFTAMTGDVTAMEYNPAGLAGLQRVDITANYVDHFEDTSFQAISVGFPFSFRTRFEPDPEGPDPFMKEKIHIGVQYRVFQAEDTARTNIGTFAGDFKIRDEMIDVAVAYPLTTRLGLGVGGKFISQKLESESVTNKAFDIGAIYKFTPRFRGGLSAVNIGSGKEFESEKDDLPTAGRLGFSYVGSRYLLLADVAQGTDKVSRESAGLEIAVNRLLKVRGGVFHDTQLQITGGIGINFAGPQKAPAYVPPSRPERRSLDEEMETPSTEETELEIKQESKPPARIDIGLDYAIQTHTELGFTHTVSLRLLY